MLAITLVELSQNPVNTNESFKISVCVKTITADSSMHRLSFTLGRKGIKTSGFYKQITQEPTMYRLPFRTGGEKVKS